MKAQVTMFMILGFIILFAAVLLIYFKATFIMQPDLIEEEVHPIQRYVEECIEQTAQQALTIMGQQGGFINIPLHINFNPSLYLNPDGLDIVKVPLWFSRGITYAPSINSVQDELSNYVEEQTKKCINNFAPFTDEFYIEEQGNLELTTFLNKEDISFQAQYPLRLTYNTNTSVTILEEFSVTVPVRLRALLQSAHQLLESEINQKYLEQFTIDLMSSNPDVPFTDMRFTCSRLEWPIKDVEEEFKDSLRVNLPRIRIQNTNYFPFLEPEKNYEALLQYDMEDIAEGNGPRNVPQDAYEYLHMFYDIGLQDDPFLSISFTLPTNDIDFNAQPNDNGILKANVIEGNAQFLRFFCVQVYHFLYDVNYPVLVSLRDDLSYNGNGYNFQFVMPVTIHHNEAFKENYGYSLFTSTTYDHGFCDTLSNEIIEIRARGKEGAINNLELDEVNISLECLNYYCPLGQTSADRGIYRLRTSLPSSCSNPFIVANKEGYLEGRAQLTGDAIDVSLKKLQDMDYEVVYHQYNSIGNVMGGSQKLDPDMQASVQIQAGDFYQFKLWPKQENSEEEIALVQLIDGAQEYDVTIVLTQGDKYVGGFVGTWNPNVVDVSTSNKVIFHALKYVPLPSDDDEKLAMTKFLLQGEYNIQPTVE